MKGLFFWPALSASLSAAWVAAGKPIQGRQSGSGWKTQVKSVLHPPTYEGSPSRAHDWKSQQIWARAQRFERKFSRSLLLGPRIISK